MADDDGCKTTLSQGFQGYIIPIFYSIMWFAMWIMVFMKLMQNKLTQARSTLRSNNAFFLYRYFSP